MAIEIRALDFAPAIGKAISVDSQTISITFDGVLEQAIDVDTNKVRLIMRQGKHAGEILVTQFDKIGIYS